HCEELNGVLSTVRGNRIDGLRRFERAIEAFEASGDVRRALSIRVNMGALLCDVGAFELAERTLREIVVTAERMNLNHVAACALVNLELVLSYLGRFEEATATAERAKALSHQQGDVRLAGFVALYLAGIAHASGRYELSESV